MASVSMTMPLAHGSGSAAARPPSSEAFFNPIHVKKPKPGAGYWRSKTCKLRVEASLKDKAVAGMTAAAAAAAMVTPEVAQAADSLTPSLQNFLLSIAAGGVVLGILAGAVVGVANFDPIKRG